MHQFKVFAVEYTD